jgi:hypothetical protein
MTRGYSSTPIAVTRAWLPLSTKHGSNVRPVARSERHRSAGRENDARWFATTAEKIAHIRHPAAGILVGSVGSNDGDRVDRCARHDSPVHVEPNEVAAGGKPHGEGGVTMSVGRGAVAGKIHLCVPDRRATPAGIGSCSDRQAVTLVRHRRARAHAQQIARLLAGGGTGRARAALVDRARELGRKEDRDRDHHRDPRDAAYAAARLPAGHTQG